MEAISASKLFLLCMLLLISAANISHCNVVSYDKKALVINGQRRILFSGSIHYPRSTPDVLFFCFSLLRNGILIFFFWLAVKIPLLLQMWEGLIQKAKDGGLDCIDTYVFWNVHEPSPGNVLQCFNFFFPVVHLFVF